jgi:response regulator RpfG family c-di-GMP phosphodiesterase
MTKLFGITDLIELNYIKWGAMLHDIGKIGMRDEILTKPGKLDSAEWLEMKIYPQIAHDILSNLDYLSQSVIKAFTKKQVILLSFIIMIVGLISMLC